MTAIERTAYPRFNHRLSDAELETFYALSAGEKRFVRSQSHGLPHQLTLALLLKSFQNLAHFPALETIPKIVIDHLVADMNLTSVPSGQISNTTLYRYHRLVREVLETRPYVQGGKAVATQAILAATQTMNDPADLINAAIDELVHQHFELPSYRHLNRLTASLRHQVNGNWYQQISSLLTEEEKEVLDSLPLLRHDATRTNFTLIKQPPKRPSLGEIRRVRDRLRWLGSLMDTTTLLKGIPAARIRLFAGEARAQEAGNIVRFSPARRYTLLICLLHEATIRTRDALTALLIRRMKSVHTGAKKSLDSLREQERELREQVVEWMGEIMSYALDAQSDEDLGRRTRLLLEKAGDIENLHDRIRAMRRTHRNNILPLMGGHYRRYRSLLFDIVEELEIHSSTQDQRLIKALDFIKGNRLRRSAHLPATIDISFVSKVWRRLIQDESTDELRHNRRFLEMAVFSYLATELQTGDVYVQSAEEYGDLRQNLLAPEECELLLAAYCEQLDIPDNGKAFAQQLKAWLESEAARVDNMLVDDLEIYFEQGKPILRRLRKQEKPPRMDILHAELKRRMPEQNLIDILAYVNKLVGFTRHFGPLSGSDTKLSDPLYRYLMTTFAHGCNLGPSQTARHAGGTGTISAMDISRTNGQHATTEKLDAMIRDVVNFFNRFDLPTHWGSGKAAAADGTLIDIYNNNLLSAYHVRYGRYGGVAYHHVSDTYIALFSHFISVGVWEAVYILDGLLENDSDIQPEMLHADTQGQSLTVFGFAHLLGIQLMPRIRNWRELKMYRPDKDTEYQNIDTLFTDVIDWKLIETHWKDMMQVILSIQAGRVLPSTLLRKLNHRSRKNRLYWAFRELGRVVRTVFLLQYISDNAVRRQITVTTNKSENYHDFADWTAFGGDVLPVNDPVEQEKRVKYNDLVSNCIILKNVMDMTKILRDLQREGYPVNPETLARLSPYQTEHIRRFGEYILEPDKIEIEPYELELLLASEDGIEGVENT